jgi:hypothetical protein
MRLRRSWLPFLATALLSVLAPTPSHADPASGVLASFQSFCGEWMHKLAAREAANQKKAATDSNGAREYVGYETTPVRCETKPTGVKSNPFVGKLVYHELRYRQPAGASAARRDVVGRVEVMEIFRFDGRRWQY